MGYSVTQLHFYWLYGYSIELFSEGLKALNVHCENLRNCVVIEISIKMQYTCVCHMLTTVSAKESVVFNN